MKTRTTRRKRGRHATKPAVLRVNVKKHRAKKYGKGAGRKPGAKDIVPRGVKATFRAICEEIQTSNHRDLKSALLDGITSGPLYAHNYLKLYRDSIDGPPSTTSNLHHSFKEDELQTAANELDRKMNALFKAHSVPA